jgi:hypothetical protein
MGRFSRAFVAIGVAALLVACSSSKSSIDTSKILTKAEYTRESDAICRTYRNRITGVVSSAGTGLSLTALKGIWTQRLIPLFQAEHQELLRLRPPKADAVRLKAALLAMNGGINTIVGRVNSANSAAQLDAINPRGLQAWNTEVRNYGMRTCGWNPGSGK